MRVVDLDRDLRDVIPTGTTRDSQYLFERMTQSTLEHARPAADRRILDVASGFGQDAIALARQGVWAVASEPSLRMLGLAQMYGGKEPGAQPLWIRSWSDGLPFADESFDAVICKGALDHFDRPLDAISEMARVTRRAGRVVLAIANFDSLSCRAARGLDRVREGWMGCAVSRGRRHYDLPSDHFTGYEIDLMREQAAAWLELEVVEGISLGWGLPSWTRWVGRLPAGAAQGALEALDRLARWLPAWADVIVLAGRPRPRGL